MFNIGISSQPRKTNKYDQFIDYTKTADISIDKNNLENKMLSSILCHYFNDFNRKRWFNYARG